jgi:hypothetical protein
MENLVAQLFMGLAELFSGLFPERFKEAARTGPIWRRIFMALFVVFGSLIVGLVVAALVFVVMFFIAAVVVGIGRALLT